MWCFMGHHVVDNLTIFSPHTQANNAIIRTFPADFKPEKRTDIMSHDQVLERLGGYDMERGKRCGVHTTM